MVNKLENLDPGSEQLEIPVLTPAPTGSELSLQETLQQVELINQIVNRRRSLSRNIRLAARDEWEISGALPKDLQVSIEPQIIRQHVYALRTWHNEAMVHLHDLVARRTTVGPDSRSLAPDVEPQLIRTSHRLISQLSKNALTISTFEATQGHWSAALDAAQECIHLRSDIAQTAIGRELRPVSKAYQKLAYARFMLEGNSPRLRAELQQGLAKIPTSKGLSYWSAHYEIMAGNYEAAYAAMQNAPNYHKNFNLIRLILAPQGEKQKPPWIQFPCNFYTYRHSLIEDDSIREIQRGLTAKFSDTGSSDDIKNLARIGLLAMNCLLLWNQGNRDMTSAKYRSAARNYIDCRTAILTYFATRFPKKFSVPSTQDGVYSELVRLARELIKIGASTPSGIPTIPIYNYFRRRYSAVTLESLYKNDWERPKVSPDGYHSYSNASEFLNIFLNLPIKFEEKVDASLLGLALVFVPLGIAEANRMCRDFDLALRECRSILKRHKELKILSEFIEKPFIKILIGQILLEKADSEYKARSLSNSLTHDQNGALRFQGLESAETYQKVLMLFEDQGQYVNYVKAGAQALEDQATTLLQRSFHPLLMGDANAGTVPPLLNDQEHVQIQLLGKDIPIKTISSKTDTLPGFERLIGPHEFLLKIQSPVGKPIIRETNPLIYALIAEAQARLLQIDAGLNYLGYRDDYVPPWRFQFLLSRARYFSEHAKNTQREYLNFLQNAEREEFQEMSVAQNVVLEKSSIRVETARVEQGRLEFEAAKQSKELAGLVRRNADLRVNRFQVFDRRADELSDEIIADAGIRTVATAASGAMGGAVTGASIGTMIAPGVGTAIGAVGGAIIGGIAGWLSSSSQEEAQAAQLAVAAEQREYELYSLRLASQEAGQSAVIAQAQLDVAKASLVVAAMQRATALLRHEFSVQNLRYLRNRTLNAELWYRLAHLIRSVSDTYLRYAVELAFLAEQAYEFEADKRINVIRFDYDVSAISSMLAADFLSRDLDTLEHDLIVSQRVRQQQVRYVVSLAREFPDALYELQQNGSTIFTLPLERLERRFPGLYNLRIGSVELRPVALMDPTRFSLELTYLGNSQVRLKTQPDTPVGQQSTSPLNRSDIQSWIPTLDQEWPVKLCVTASETTVFSGLSQAERESIFSFVTSSQRQAFEHLGAAASWRIDMSMRENQVIPSTLVDFIITFNLSGYYDPVLRSAIESVPRPLTALTQWFSGRQSFTDAFYTFNQKGLMEWEITNSLLSLTDSAGSMRNIGVMIIPTTKRPQFGRLLCSHLVTFTITPEGALQIESSPPQVKFTSNQLTLGVQASVPAGNTVSWDFGDNSDWQEGLNQQHNYTKPGAYEVGLRVVRNGQLFQYKASVIVSRQHAVQPPLTAFPQLSTVAGAPAGQTRVIANTQVPAEESITAIWKLLGQSASHGTNAQFDLPPGQYILAYTAVRDLKARIYSRQRYSPNQQISINALRIATNREFDSQGDEQNIGARNTLATHIFNAGPASPVDHWTLELPVADNPFLRSVTQTDLEQLDLSELKDVILTCEYEVGSM